MIHEERELRRSLSVCVSLSLCDKRPDDRGTKIRKEREKEKDVDSEGKAIRTEDNKTGRANTL